MKAMLPQMGSKAEFKTVLKRIHRSHDVQSLIGHVCVNCLVETIEGLPDGMASQALQELADEIQRQRGFASLVFAGNLRARYDLMNKLFCCAIFGVSEAMQQNLLLILTFDGSQDVIEGLVCQLLALVSECNPTLASRFDIWAV